VGADPNPHCRHTRRRPKSSPIEYLIPEGPLTSLLLLHIDRGQRTLTQATGGTVTRLFVTKKGGTFCLNDSIFTQFWRTLMKQFDADRYGLDYFPPAQARTIFVDDYLSQNGVDPEMWDGACWLRSLAASLPLRAPLLHQPILMTRCRRTQSFALARRAEHLLLHH
jgi:hypothetical protein